MLTILVAICVFGLRSQPELSLTAIGALVGALLLSKVNSGTFALVAVGYATVMAPPGHLSRSRACRASTCGADCPPRAS